MGHTRGGRSPCAPISISAGAAAIRWPVGSYHSRRRPPPATTEVVWAYAQGASATGDPHPAAHPGHRTRMREGDRVTGVQTAKRTDLGADRDERGRPAGRPAWRTWPACACRSAPTRSRLWSPIPTALGFEPIVASSPELPVLRLSRRPGATCSWARSTICHLRPYPRGIVEFEFLLASVAAKRITKLLPFMGDLRVLRQWAGICDITPGYSPIMGEDRPPRGSSSRPAGARGVSRPFPPSGEKPWPN